MRFKTTYVDPPWPETGGGRIRRGADRHYKLMTVKQIIALPIGDLAAPNAHLYLWATNNHLEDAFAAIRAWGFTYKTMITWPKPRIGIGQYFRGMTEHCLFAVRGSLPYKVRGRKRQQGRTLLSVWRGAHSEKPEEMRQMIEKVSYGPRVELFARKRSPGWEVWGDGVKGVGVLKYNATRGWWKT